MSTERLAVKLEHIGSLDIDTFLYQTRTLLQGLREPRNQLEKIIDRYADNKPCLVAAVYCLATWFRRNSRFSDFRTLVEKFRITLEDNDRFSFGLLPLYYYHAPRTSHGTTAAAIHYARQAIEKHKESSGLLNQYAEMIANLLEDDAVSHSHLQQELQEAESASRRSIAKTSGTYGKYLAVCARLVALQGRHDEANRLFLSAIDTEDTSRSDYALRVTEYQLWRTRAELDKKLQEVHKVGTEAVDRVESLRSSLIQILGLLASVVAFVVSSANIARSSGTAKDAASIIIIQGGVLAVVFSLFSIVFMPKLSIWSVLSAAIGVVITASFYIFLL